MHRKFGSQKRACAVTFVYLVALKPSNRSLFKYSGLLKKLDTCSIGVFGVQTNAQLKKNLRRLGKTCAKFFKAIGQRMTTKYYNKKGWSHTYNRCNSSWCLLYFQWAFCFPCTFVYYNKTHILSYAFEANVVQICPPGCHFWPLFVNFAGFDTIYSYKMDTSHRQIQDLDWFRVVYCKYSRCAKYSKHIIIKLRNGIKVSPNKTYIAITSQNL